MRSLPPNLAQGQAGVYVVAANLLLRGINPTFPAVDIGADIVTEEGIRIQVKSSHLRNQMLNGRPMYRNGAYMFKLDTRHLVRKRTITFLRRQFSEECDFVILWGIEDNKFWILPAALIDGRTGCSVGRPAAWVDADIEAIRDARNAGQTWEEISSQHNVKIGTAFRSFHGLRDAPSAKTTLTQKIRECEGRWDLILGAVQALSGAKAAVEGISEEVHRE